jgi:hypothetical protein
VGYDVLASREVAGVPRLIEAALALLSEAERERVAGLLFRERARVRVEHDHILIEELEITNVIRLPRETMESHGARRSGGS